MKTLGAKQAGIVIGTAVLLGGMAIARTLTSSSGDWSSAFETILPSMRPVKAAQPAPEKNTTARVRSAAATTKSLSAAGDIEPRAVPRNSGRSHLRTAAYKGTTGRGPNGATPVSASDSGFGLASYEWGKAEPEGVDRHSPLPHEVEAEPWQSAIAPGATGFARTPGTEQKRNNPGAIAVPDHGSLPALLLWALVVLSAIKIRGMASESGFAAIRA